MPCIYVYMCVCTCMVRGYFNGNGSFLVGREDEQDEEEERADLREFGDFVLQNEAPLLHRRLLLPTSAPHIAQGVLFLFLIFFIFFFY